jgi:hypothetical protein
LIDPHIPRCPRAAVAAAGALELEAVGVPRLRVVAHAFVAVMFDVGCEIADVRPVRILGR